MLKSEHKKRYSPFGLYLWISGFLKQDSLPALAMLSMRGEAVGLSLSEKKSFLFKEPDYWGADSI